MFFQSFTPNSWDLPLSKEFTQADLEAYLDEALPPDEMAEVEEQLRNNPEMGHRLVAIHGRRDAGVHTLGEIWRRHRLTCPSREQLTLYLDGKLEQEVSEHVRFHLEEIHCRLCVASFEDVKISRDDNSDEVVSRRQRILDRSSHYLRKSD